MGGWWSSPQSTAGDSNGEVNNNIIIGERIDENSYEITAYLAVICFIKIIELVVFVYVSSTKKFNKKYQPRSDTQTP